MTFLTRAGVLGFAVLSSVGCGHPEPDIEAASVKRVITTLSADEMAGRAPFTSAIDKAARFIRDEFASIGLRVPDGGTTTCSGSRRFGFRPGVRRSS